MDLSEVDKNPEYLNQFTVLDLEDMEFVLEIELLVQRKAGAKKAGEITYRRLVSVRNALKRNNFAGYLLRRWGVIS